MTDDITIYYNPRCSKCRLTLDLLEQEGRQVQIVEYLTTPPTTETLASILDMLGLEPRELMRRHEQEYTAAGLDNPDLDRDALIAAMVRYPRLIERPIVIKDGKAAIGRPPEKVLDIL